MDKATETCLKLIHGMEIIDREFDMSTMSQLNFFVNQDARSSFDLALKYISLSEPHSTPFVGEKDGFYSLDIIRNRLEDAMSGFREMKRIGAIGKKPGEELILQDYTTDKIQPYVSHLNALCRVGILSGYTYDDNMVILF